jgi:hypothetical protein
VVHHVKRIARIVAGFLLLLAGTAMLVLPGPGWVTIGLGLALLARDFPWAHNALERLKYVWHICVDSARCWWRRFRTGSSAADDGRMR